ncbi:putative bifunctional diguanylate cyclase/phosphodiesterase [Novacetimonas pomaceti]|uniref:putative bifunctional diguanylate cyclase/phosphodiesterase n=1 Tax=Novacetimonas pomaceti TaxID=2021998 RepID=UPI001EF00857|nr:EAL domain-containing protein [Novacetimonas pomaceti]
MPLLISALIVCIAGSWITVRIVARIAATAGRQNQSWYLQCAAAGATTIWCTHFLALLAYMPDVAGFLNIPLTLLSFLIAVGGVLAATVIATTSHNRMGPALGGAVLGLAIAGMHYSGMYAVEFEEHISWSMSTIALSLLSGIGFGVLSFQCLLRSGNRHRELLATVLFVAAIAGLHFVGMSAMHMTGLPHDLASSGNAPVVLGVALALMTLLLVATGGNSFSIDDATRAESYERLRQMALHDALTSLPNRISFNEHLDQVIEDAKKDGTQFALIGIDLNKFKEINDVRGHAAGDAVLVTIANRFTEMLGKREFVARLGGDEFAAVHLTSDPEELNAFVARIEEAINLPIPIEDYEVTTGGSVGLALFPKDATDKETLVTRADLAMYRAKADPVRTVAYYEPSMDETVREARALAADLKTAMEKGELSLHYQVQTAIATGEIFGYEALLRWHHPKRGEVPPAQFIPVAEENGLIIPLGEWVLRTACAQAAHWDHSYKLAVNLSPVQFFHPDLSRLVKETLESTGLPPERLELELTETSIIDDKQRALEIVRRIKELGVSIALDDFGTGYSSIDTLRSFPFDRIKLDGSFMQGVETNSDAAAIVRSVLALGRTMNISVLAEGIETQRQLEVLKGEGCVAGQGFLLGRPASPETLGLQPAKSHPPACPPDADQPTVTAQL